MGKLLIYIILFTLFVVVIVLAPKYNSFKNSEYKNSSGNSFFKILSNKGDYGEFLTFEYLERLDGFNRLLTNVYLPASANIHMYQ